MCKVYTDVGGIKQLYHVCPPVCKIIHSLKPVDYLHVQADNPWYNYYVNCTHSQSCYFYLPSLSIIDSHFESFLKNNVVDDVGYFQC